MSGRWWVFLLFSCAKVGPMLLLSALPLVFLVPGGSLLPSPVAEARDLTTALAMLTPADGEAGGELWLPAGRYEVPDSVVVRPAGDLLLEAGTVIAMGSGAAIKTMHKITAVGTAAEPILLTALDPQRPWGVVLLADPAGNGSLFEHCVVEYASQRRIDGTLYGGAITSSGVELTLRDCWVHDIPGEDGVNVDRARAEILFCTFDRCPDAIDFDGSRGGVVANCLIRDSIDDGVDLGEGSVSSVHHNVILRSADKGISVGEGSNSDIYNNLIGECLTGIAIKDRSDPWVRNNTIVGCESGVRAYEKNPFQGGGRGQVIDTIVWASTLVSVDLDAKSTTAFYHCDIAGGWAGNGNIDADPGFVSFAGMDNLLATGSPCIDAGLPGGVDALSDWYSEWPGGLAPNGPVADIGAYGGRDNDGWLLGYGRRE